MRAILAQLVSVIVCALAGAPQTIPSYNIYRASSPIIIDGKLDERAWQKAPIATGFHFNWWTAGDKQQTAVRLLWDDKNLYVAYYCYDKHISADVTEHQGGVSKDDAVEFYVGPDPNKPRDWDGLEINAIGTVLAFRVRDGKVQTGWEPEGLRCQTSLLTQVKRESPEDDHWIVEMAIPWRNFSDQASHTPPHDGDRWRVNLNRIDRTVAIAEWQYSTWSPVNTPKPKFAVPEAFGSVRFVNRKPPRYLPDAAKK